MSEDEIVEIRIIFPKNEIRKRRNKNSAAITLIRKVLKKNGTLLTAYTVNYWL